MNLEEWRKLRAEGDEATLPSGLGVRLRRVSTLDLAEKGRIPQELRPKLEQMMAGGQTSVTLDQFIEYADIINLVVGACLTGPEGLTLDELPYTDRLSIFGWANEMGEKLSTFRRSEGKPVESAFAVGDLRHATKRRAGAGF